MSPGKRSPSAVAPFRSGTMPTREETQARMNIIAAGMMKHTPEQSYMLPIVWKNAPPGSRTIHS